MTDHTDQKPVCIVCERSDDTLPLIQLRYQGERLWICPMHLPILIHKPQQLTEKFPGATIEPADHSDH